MSKKILTARATELGLSFSSKTTVAELENLISVKEMELSAETVIVDEELVKTAKRKALSKAPRGEDGKVIRKGANLSGNTPYRGKNYFVDLEIYLANAAAVEKMPGQVKIILKTMVDHEITSVSSAVRGVHVVDFAKADGMKTKIDSDRLFAYYRRLMELVGLTFVGNAKTSTGEDVDVGEEDEADAA